MIPYVVRPGDFLTGIAQRRGFDPQQVWQHPQNADLRRRRSNPEILAAGDILYVPDSEPRRHRLSVGATNSFSTRLAPPTIKLTLTGSDGRPLAGKRYWVDGEEAGTTDDAGNVEIAVPGNQPTVSLRVEGSEDTYRLRVAHLEPVDTDAGVRQRLLNLRYLHEDAVHTSEADVADALRRFQERSGLEATGAADDATRDRLVSEHGS